ncbi:hypothetical protein OIV83_001111 [Microbotryomycetes sp. JL201]|nr:hypothetical protein OIV83_001111 [Microbotryomycetes sp. JL201]
MHRPTDPNDSGTLLGLPIELLTVLLSDFIDLDSLLQLRLVSRSLDRLVIDSLLPLYLLRAASIASIASVKQRVVNLPLAKQARWTHDVSQNWTTWSDVRAQSLNGLVNGEWKQRCMPIIKLWNRHCGENRVVVARGHELDFIQVLPDRSHTRNEFVQIAPVVQEAMRKQGQFLSPRQVVGAADITGLCPLTDSDIVISRVSGHVQRLSVSEPTWTGPGTRWQPGSLVEKARYSVVPADVPSSHSATVQAIHAVDSMLASAFTARSKPPQRNRRRPLSPRVVSRDIVSLGAALASRAIEQKYGVSLTNLNSPWQAPQGIKLPMDAGKPWCVLLSPRTSPSRWLAIGSTSSQPLSVVMIDGNGATADSSVRRLGQPLASKSSVYSICVPQPSSTALNPHHTLVAAYYDSSTRVFDLRVRDEFGPAVELRDPWSDDASYSVTTCGHQGAYIACGTSRNGSVRLWDIRNFRQAVHHPNERASTKVGEDNAYRKGRTMFLPGKDRSPVYSLAGEYSRMWAVTDRRTVCVDFDSSGYSRWRTSPRHVSRPNARSQPEEEWDEAVWFCEHEQSGEMKRSGV